MRRKTPSPRFPGLSYDEAAYAKHLLGLSDAEFLDEVFDQIDRANQSPIFSIADGKASQLRDEAKRRDRQDLYDRGFNAARAAAKGDRHYRTAMVELGTAI
jgi:hypothetical protein